MTNQIWKYEPKNGDKLGKLVEKDNDIVMTNPEMAKHLISTIQFRDGDVVCDPCRGKGAFYNNFPDNVKKIYFEINEDKDYLSPDCFEMADITISNPPFVPRKLFWDFHVKAMHTTRRNIYWLVNLSSLNIFTPKRIDEMIEKNWFLEHLHIVSDKRWFGRYALIRFGKDASKNILSFNRNSF